MNGIVEQLKQVAIEVISQAVTWDDGNELVRACARALRAISRPINRPEHQWDQLEQCLAACEEMMTCLRQTERVKRYYPRKPHPLATSVSLVLHDLEAEVARMDA